MPLKEPYVSPMIHKDTVYKPDPASLPIAGRVDNKGHSDPKNKHVFNRRKAPEDTHAHLVTSTSTPFTANSLSRETFVAHEIERRKPRLDPAKAASVGGRLTGLGKNVEATSDTASWQSTKQSGIDGSAVQKWGNGGVSAKQSVAEARDKRLEKVREQSTMSEARGNYGAGCFEPCVDARAKRVEQLTNKKAVPNNIQLA